MKLLRLKSVIFLYFKFRLSGITPRCSAGYANYPQPKGHGFSKVFRHMKLHGLKSVVSLYFKLRLSAVFFLLKTYVPPDDGFVNANGRDEISNRPNPSAISVKLGEKWKFLLQGMTSASFHNLHCIADAHSGWDDN